MNKYLVFNLRNEKYALNIKNIREIIEYKEPSEIPHAGSHIVGMIKIRDDVITLMNSEGILNVKSEQEDSLGKILICEEGERKAGVLVDDVSSVISIEESEIQDSPLKGMGITQDRVDYVKGVLNTDEGLIIIIDIEKTKLFAKEEV